MSNSETRGHSKSYSTNTSMPRFRSASATDKLPGFEPPPRNSAQVPLFGALKSRVRSLPLVGSAHGPARWRRYVLRGLILLVCCLALGAVLRYKRREREELDNRNRKEREIAEQAFTRYWTAFPMLQGYWNGVRTLVRASQWEPEPLQYDMQSPERETHLDHAEDHVDTSYLPSIDGSLRLSPQRYSPYPLYNSTEYLAKHFPVETCYIDEDEKVAGPDIFAYPGIPQNHPLPFFGTYKELGLRDDMCFERFGRLGPYGYGYSAAEGGVGLGMRSEQQGAEEIWQNQPKIDWSEVDWSRAQARCYDKNRRRFEADTNGNDDSRQKIPRQAFVLRSWTDFVYTPHEILTIRSMINELSIKSGGEYDVHLLLHVKNDSVPIFTSDEVYRQMIEMHVPREFWGITTLWSQQLMKMYYPGPFGEPPANIAGQEIHSVYRSAHFAMQWFAQQHPEYDYVWNWEMDMRYSGHYYEFHQQVGEWARKQPRRGLWERNEKFWLPAFHGSWSNFSDFIEHETELLGEEPVWGPVTFPNSGMLKLPADTEPPHRASADADAFQQWGVGEEADLITFNPIFNPNKTNWVFRSDISGYDLTLPIPPRRCAIVTVSRLSRRLLDTMHDETFRGLHSAFPEMWAPTVALHHGYKAVFVPHPVYFDRKWALDYMNQIFNYPATIVNSVFGWGEHNWEGSSFYYNSGFSGLLWRRWLGERELDNGGAGYEIDGTGRLCFRPILHHPIKSEDSPES